MFSLWYEILSSQTCQTNCTVQELTKKKNYLQILLLYRVSLHWKWEKKNYLQILLLWSISRYWKWELLISLASQSSILALKIYIYKHMLFMCFLMTWRAGVGLKLNRCILQGVSVKDKCFERIPDMNWCSVDCIWIQYLFSICIVCKLHSKYFSLSGSFCMSYVTLK